MEPTTIKKENVDEDEFRANIKKFLEERRKAKLKAEVKDAQNTFDHQNKSIEYSDISDVSLDTSLELEEHDDLHESIDEEERENILYDIELNARSDDLVKENP